VFAAAYQGRVVRACLATNAGSLTKNSTTAQWDAAEISAQASEGYARVQWTIPAGAYDAATGRFRSPQQLATFTAAANGLGLTYDTLYIVLGTAGGGGAVTWDATVAMLHVEAPSIALSPGEPRSYRVRLLTDDITTVA
jgi:hypothetical protein